MDQLSWWWIVIIPLAGLLAVAIIAAGVAWGILTAWRVIKRDLTAEFGLGRRLSSPRDLLIGFLGKHDD